MALNIQTPVTGIIGTLGTAPFENYMAATVEEITIGRNPVTSIAPLPNRVFDVLWKMDLNLALANANVKSPSVVDVSEQVQTLVSTGVYAFTLTTNNLSSVINVTQALVSTTYTLTYASLVSGTGTSIVEAAAVLATKLSTDGSIVTVLNADGSQNVYSSLTPNYTTVVSSSILNPLGSIGATGTAQFMAYLKGTSGNVGTTGSWYAANTNNNQSIQTQVKLGLAQLFDKDPQLNNLIGSASSSSTFLDSSKIAAKMQLTTDTFWTKFFSDQQFREVLSAVTDKGSRITKGAAGVNTFNFSTGDTISAMLKVTDTDTTSLNSDRWMITLQQV